MRLLPVPCPPEPFEPTPPHNITVMRTLMPVGEVFILFLLLKSQLAGDELQNKPNHTNCCSHTHVDASGLGFDNVFFNLMVIFQYWMVLPTCPPLDDDDNDNYLNNCNDKNDNNYKVVLPTCPPPACPAPVPAPAPAVNPRTNVVYH